MNCSSYYHFSSDSYSDFTLLALFHSDFFVIMKLFGFADLSHLVLVEGVGKGFCCSFSAMVLIYVFSLYLVWGVWLGFVVFFVGLLFCCLCFHVSGDGISFVSL